MESKNSDLEILHHEFIEAKAQLLLTALKQEGVYAVMTNKAMATMIPVQSSGFIIRVSGKDYDRAKVILKEFNDQLGMKLDEDFSDASHEDIVYEETLARNEASLDTANSNQLVFLILVMVFILIVYLYFRH